MTANTQITSEQREAAELEIREQQKLFDYDTRDYPIELLVTKYLDGIEDNKNEIFIPTYQRELVWNEKRQSNFIEFVLLGFPIPSLFFYKKYDSGNNLERLELIDGSQRIRTLASFLNDELKLQSLKKIEKLNGFTFSDLPLIRQKRFQRRTLRVIILNSKVEKEVIDFICERTNVGIL